MLELIFGWVNLIGEVHNYLLDAQDMYQVVLDSSL